jgi:hypothetical protein
MAIDAIFAVTYYEVTNEKIGSVGYHIAATISN